MTTPPAPPDLVLTGRFAPDQERIYAHVPFTVPTGTSQLHISWQYSGRIASDPLLAGGNTLDLGLFDHRGRGAGGAGFRGWSGSAQDELTIAAGWATPPYRAGAIGPGTWHILLGPYKVAANGLDYQIEIWFNPGLVPAPVTVRPSPAPLTLPPPAEAGWLRCDLHCHSRYSDGDAWPAELRAAAAAAGLDVLGITDHNSAHAGPATDDGERPFLLPGAEVTTYGGHWNVWGTSTWHEFRHPNREAAAAAMRAAAAAGGVISINHPKPFGPPWSYGDDLSNHAVEVWNGPWDRLNWIALAAWEAQLRAGRRLTAIGGSDTHYLSPADPAAPAALPRAKLGGPTTWLHLPGEVSVSTILDAIRRGRCFISRSPAGPELYVQFAGAALSLHLVNAAEAILIVVADGKPVSAAAIPTADWTTKVPLPAAFRYVRAQVVDTFGTVLALSNALRADA